MVIILMDLAEMVVVVVQDWEELLKIPPGRCG
jgi:hypothetical protein